MIQAIVNRRSIRKYQEREVPISMVEEILRAGILAPSSKNRQPWHFIVVTGQAKTDILARMQQGLDRERTHPLLPENAQHLDGARHTLDIMKQAPVIIFVVNTLADKITDTLTTEQRIGEICNAQSIGAAMENMTLTATELGLGSLWICDTFFAQKELRESLDIEGELYGALAVGYADEMPLSRPRYEMGQVVEWRS